MHKKSLLLAAIVFGVMAIAQPVNAQYAISQPPSPQFFVNKTLLDPRNNQFVDNLSLDQFQFLPSNEVWFRIEVRNNSTTDLQNVVVTDRLPQQVTYVSGGTFDNNSNVTFRIDNLKAGTSQFFDIKTKVKSDGELATMVTCPTNFVQATSGNAVQQDTASFCVQKRILGDVFELPRTGPTGTIAGLALSVFGLIGSLGFWIKGRKTA